VRGESRPARMPEWGNRPYSLIHTALMDSLAGPTVGDLHKSRSSLYEVCPKSIRLYFSPRIISYIANLLNPFRSRYCIF
jgi:hypothetical protein